jgi:hypothetical protein
MDWAERGEPGPSSRDLGKETVSTVNGDGGGSVPDAVGKGLGPNIAAPCVSDDAVGVIVVAPRDGVESDAPERGA